MTYNGFVLQQHKIYGKEEQVVISHCITHDIPYKICSMTDPVPDDMIPCGTVEWCEKFLSKEKTVPNYYPDFLKEHLFRKVWREDKWPLGKRVFIKPADRHKRFIGFCTTGGYRKKKRGPYWCSEIVKFTNEWRYYIADGKVLTGEWYDGINQESTPEAPDLKINIPGDFCGALDFGFLSTGEFALIEANSPYACGWYGKIINCM